MKKLKPVDDSGRIVEGDWVEATSVTFNSSFVVWTGLSVVVDSSIVVGASVKGWVAFSVETVLGAIVTCIVSLAVKTNRDKLMWMIN